MTFPIITLLSDFGSSTGYPAQMKGVILTLCRQSRLVDICHDVPSFRIIVGQAILRDTVAVFPEGTVHLAVVDPGVGSARRPIIVVGGDKAPGQLFVGPDNGLLWPFVKGGKVYEIVNPAFRRGSVSNTFHGRDIFAPAAAHLALGVPPEQFGPEIADPVKLSPPRVRHEGGAIVGEIVHVDAFGNLISNLCVDDLPRADFNLLKVSVGGRTLSGLKATYSEVAGGSLVAIVGSSGFLEIALREGSAAKELKLEEGFGMPVVVEQG